MSSHLAFDVQDDSVQDEQINPQIAFKESN